MSVVCTTPLLVGGRPIGHGGRAYVIAEAGVNHGGSLDRALALVDAAAACGADAVKFQAFRADELVTAGAPKAAYQRAADGATQREMLRGLELSERDWEAVAQRCATDGIDFLATPFGIAQVGLVERLGAPAVKIASADLTSVPLLQAAIETGLPVLLSTGASREDEIADAVELFRRHEADQRLVLLHCVSAYPTPIDAANLAAIRTLRERFDQPCGYSDHTTAIEAGGWAVAAGACVIEKHFTVDRAAGGPDQTMSLAPEAFTRYLELTRAAEAAMGAGRIGCQPIESDVRAVARRSVVAAAPLRAGARLTLADLALKRPGGGIAPGEIERLVGRVVRADVPADTPLRWDMLAE